MHRGNKGFTLVELMVTIAIAAILLTVGVPSLKSLYDAYRGNSEISRIQQALSFARNQAISYGMSVEVCANGGNECGSDWSNGLLVHVTNAADSSNNGQVLKVVADFNSSDSISGDAITFRTDGLSNNSATFVYCPNGTTEASRSVTVASSGMIRYGADNLSCN